MEVGQKRKRKELEKNLGGVCSALFNRGGRPIEKTISNLEMDEPNSFYFDSTCASAHLPPFLILRHLTYQ